ncbi:MAG: hypothetical protein IKK44_01140, partial [Clostridium sp.]|nr:hypothetical protein [Clostridium sp.]
LVLNGSGQPVEIDNIMLDEIDDYFDSQISDLAECSSMVADAPPIKRRHVSACRLFIGFRPDAAGLAPLHHLTAEVNSA